MSFPFHSLTVPFPLSPPHTVQERYLKEVKTPTWCLHGPSEFNCADLDLFDFKLDNDEVFYLVRETLVGLQHGLIFLFGCFGVALVEKSSHIVLDVRGVVL